MSHVFVYQEWDIMREVKTQEEKLEKATTIVPRTNMFSLQLQEARIRQRMTVSQLAEKCGMSSRQMSLYENGSENPTPEIYAVINELLKME